MIIFYWDPWVTVFLTLFGSNDNVFTKLLTVKVRMLAFDHHEFSPHISYSTGKGNIAGVVEDEVDVNAYVSSDVCFTQGDYNILVLEHLAATAEPPHPFDLSEFVPRWKRAMKT